MEQPTNNIITRVLIIDDDEDDALIIEKLLKSLPDSEIEVDWESSFDGGVNRIYAAEHDIYLIDYRLGGQTGIDLLNVVKPRKRPEPFIMMSGANDRALLIESMKYAAADFLVKNNFDKESLSKAIFYALERKKMEKERIAELVELNRSKDEFISIASHQLRTPATGVKQYLGMLKEGFAGGLAENQQKLVEKAYESNERQLKIVTDLLKVAQVDAGKVVLQRSVVDLKEVLDETIQGMQSIFKEREQNIHYQTTKEPMKCNVDEATIRMVLENLIENASKYSENGKNIWVNIAEENGKITVNVADEGVGIKESDRDKLFTKFTRIDNSLSTKVGGTGLGLYWARKIINLHGGSLTHQSRYDDNGKVDGSVFTVKMPKIDNSDVNAVK